MRSLLTGVLLCTSLAAPVVAEALSFAVNDPSGQYQVEVLFPQEPETPYQLVPALITLRDRHTLETLQQLRTPAGNLSTQRDDNSLMWLLGPYGLVNFIDFNNDGRLDLVIRNGSSEAGDQSRFDVYLQDGQKPQWVLNEALTDLATQSSSGLFTVNPTDGTLHSQTNSGCCQITSTQWALRDGQLIRLHAYTQEEVSPSTWNDTSSMPRGYMLRTTGELKDGQWHEQTRLEGPVTEDPQMLRGLLNGKIPVELWYQDQGAVLIGEVRYTKGGNGQPIKLLGFRDSFDEVDNTVVLLEIADDGRKTGIWRMTRATSEPYVYSGTWISGTKGDARELAISLHDEERAPEMGKLYDVPRDQRSGHYQVRNDFLGRDGDLALKILPDRDAQGRELAEVTVKLRDTATSTEIVTEHHIVPMAADNLIIVQTPQAPEKNGPYHIQLVKNFAVIAYNYATDSQDMLTGVYRKQP